MAPVVTVCSQSQDSSGARANKPARRASTSTNTRINQFRDQITAIPPFIYNKDFGRIITIPELPSLNELDEQENLSNSSVRPVRVNDIDTNSCTMYPSSKGDNFEHKRTIKPKTARKIKPKSCKVQKRISSTRLETKSSATKRKKQETLTTSFVEETVDADNFEYPEPALEEAPILEDMPTVYKFQTNKPTASQTSRDIPSTRLSIVLERISSDEIARWQTSQSTENKFVDPASVDRCGANRSVQDCLNRNATPNSPSAADNRATKEMLSQMMETLQTELAEILQATCERFQEKLEEVIKQQIERVCEDFQRLHHANGP